MKSKNMKTKLITYAVFLILLLNLFVTYSFGFTNDNKKAKSYYKYSLVKSVKMKLKNDSYINIIYFVSDGTTITLKVDGKGNHVFKKDVVVVDGSNKSYRFSLEALSWDNDITWKGSYSSRAHINHKTSLSLVVKKKYKMKLPLKIIKTNFK